MLVPIEEWKIIKDEGRWKAAPSCTQCRGRIQPFMKFSKEKLGLHTVPYQSAWY